MGLVPFLRISLRFAAARRHHCGKPSLGTRLMDSEALDTQLYYLLAQVISPLTASLRFNGTRNVHVAVLLNEFGASLALSHFAVQLLAAIAATTTYHVPLSVAGRLLINESLISICHRN